MARSEPGFEVRPWFPLASPGLPSISLVIVIQFLPLSLVL